MPEVRYPAPSLHRGRIPAASRIHGCTSLRRRWSSSQGQENAVNLSATIELLP
jgi:hypothetical protein